MTSFAAVLAFAYVAFMTDDVALLLRRAGFGPTAAELAAAKQSGYGATLAGLVAPPGPDVGATATPIPRLGQDPFVALPDPTAEQSTRAHAKRKQQVEQLSRWWLDRIVVASHQAVEKLVFFWHGHWATSVVKVRSAQLMLGHHRTLRESRDFADMAHRMVDDRALVYWLDGQHNKRFAPNENLARELFELFMLGIGQYTEKDVKEAARALTGYRIALDKERLVFDPPYHDEGRKTVLGKTANFNPRTLVDLVLRQEACPRFIAARLWYRYASTTEPIPEGLREAMAAEFPAPMKMLRVLLQHDAFIATRGTMVKQPMEWLTGAMRQLGVRPGGLEPDVFTRFYWWLDGLGQRPFAPPSVGGWPAGAAWLTSAAAQLKLTVAYELAGLAGLDRLTPEDVAYLLCVDKWTNRTYELMRGVQDPRTMLTLGLVSPEYQVT